MFILDTLPGKTIKMLYHVHEIITKSNLKLYTKFYVVITAYEHIPFCGI